MGYFAQNRLCGGNVGKVSQSSGRKGELRECCTEMRNNDDEVVDNFQPFPLAHPGQCHTLAYCTYLVTLSHHFKVPSPTRCICIWLNSCILFVSISTELCVSVSLMGRENFKANFSWIQWFSRCVVCAPCQLVNTLHYDSNEHAVNAPYVRLQNCIPSTYLRLSSALASAILGFACCTDCTQEK